MTDGHPLLGRRALRYAARGVVIDEERDGRLDERAAEGREVASFADEVREREADVERRIAPVDHLMVEQDEPPVVHEHVLRAEIAVDQRQPAGARVAYELVQKIGRLRHARGGVGVIRLDSEGLEKRSVGKRLANRVARFE